MKAIYDESFEIGGLCDPSDWCLDAGMAPIEPRGEFRFTYLDIERATDEELIEMKTFHMYENQACRWEDDFITGDLLLLWKFVTPTITSLEK